MLILAIDPGNIDSAFVLLGDSYTIYDKGKVKNDSLLKIIEDYAHCCNYLVVERIASYGMAVGKTVFETCEWVGRFAQKAIANGYAVDYVYRLDEKLAICHDAKAGDANIRRALIDRFAKHDFKNGKGTKKKPDVFYGFAADEWAAMAVGVTWLDRREEKPCTLVPLQSRKESTASSQGAKAAPSPLTPSV